MSSKDQPTLGIVFKELSSLFEFHKSNVQKCLFLQGSLLHSLCISKNIKKSFISFDLVFSYFYLANQELLISQASDRVFSHHFIQFLYIILLHYHSLTCSLFHTNFGISFASLTFFFVDPLKVQDSFQGGHGHSKSLRSWLGRVSFWSLYSLIVEPIHLFRDSRS